MFYFNSFPNISSTDYNGNKVVLSNILERVEVIPTQLNNINVFYKYNIKDNDTPDIIANKYYGDSYRYWMVAFANQLIDVQGGWPMPSNLFNDYIVDKYTSATANSLNIPANTVTSGQVLAYTQSTIYDYIKSVTTIDSISSKSTTIKYIIDAASYANVTNQTITKSFSGGATVTEIVTAYPQYIYDYEVEQNEAKRNISLFKSDYAGALEKQLYTLLGN
jgi:nucleoid-associated protein YgaU